MIESMGDLSALVDLVASGAGPGAVAGWLEEAAGCTAVLAAGAEPPPAAPAAPPAAALSALSAGRTAEPLEAGGGGQQVLVVPVGVMSPRPLLWAWRAAGWDERGREAAVRAAGVGATLAAAAKAAVGAAATMAGRIAGWQALMAGDVVRAARTLAPLVPQLVPAGAGQVGVLEVPAGADRLAAAREVDHLLEDHGALVVTYPVDDRQIIIVMPGSRLLEDLEPVLGHGRPDGQAARVRTVARSMRSAAVHNAMLTRPSSKPAATSQRPQTPATHSNETGTPTLITVKSTKPQRRSSRQPISSYLRGQTAPPQPLNE